LYWREADFTKMAPRLDSGRIFGWGRAFNGKYPSLYNIVRKNSFGCTCTKYYSAKRLLKTRLSGGQFGQMDESDKEYSYGES
jgi:hypothetical protein